MPCLSVQRNLYSKDKVNMRYSKDKVNMRYSKDKVNMRYSKDKVDMRYSKDKVDMRDVHHVNYIKRDVALCRTCEYRPCHAMSNACPTAVILIGGCNAALYCPPCQACIIQQLVLRGKKTL